MTQKNDAPDLEFLGASIVAKSIALDNFWDSTTKQVIRTLKTLQNAKDRVIFKRAIRRAILAKYLIIPPVLANALTNHRSVWD